MNYYEVGSFVIGDSMPKGKTIRGSSVLSVIETGYEDGRKARMLVTRTGVWDLTQNPDATWEGYFRHFGSEEGRIGYHHFATNCGENDEMVYVSREHFLIPGGWAVVVTTTEYDTGDEIEADIFAPGTWELELSWGRFGSRGGKWIKQASCQCAEYPNGCGTGGTSFPPCGI